MVHTVATLSAIVDGHVREIQTTKQGVTQLAARMTGLEAKMDFQFEQLMAVIKSMGKRPCK